MGRGAFLSIAVIAALAVTLACAPAALAARSQESIFMDDSELVYGSDAQVEATMSIMRSLGVDRVRVSVIWRLMAPGASSRTRPAFSAGGPSDPAAYPPQHWDRYDRVVDAARRHRLRLLFTVTGPGPVWASRNPARDDQVHDPDPADFGAFVTAVGRRYSGSYADERVQAPASPGGLPIVSPPPPPPAEPPPSLLPRVSFWSIWNEPNQPGWLRPQTRGGPRSPHLYRALFDEAYAALGRSGHAGDTILLGETAPRGSSRPAELSPMRPGIFIRELYCVDRGLRPYRGERAAQRGCPGNAARFAARHPGLFAAGGWAHHPYALEVAPSRPEPVRDHITLSTLSRLTGTLDRIFRRHGSQRRLPVWLTEYGYQTDPPDPIIGVSWRQQAGYLSEAEEIAYRSPRVRSQAQFLLIDDGPNPNVPPGSPRYWGSTFQSGLVTREGTQKPAFVSYQRPLHVSPARARRGRRLRVFGQLRPARNGSPLSARLEFRPERTGRWATIRRVRTSSFRNYLVVRVPATTSGHYRLAWRLPSRGALLRSRAAYVRVR